MERAWLRLLSNFLTSAGRLLQGPPGDASPPAEQAQLPQPLLRGEVLQSPPMLVTIPSTHSVFNVFLAPGSPKLDIVFQTQFYDCQEKGDNHFPLPIYHCPPVASCQLPLLPGHSTAP